MNNEEMTTGDNVAIELMTDLLAHNVVECEDVAFRNINGRTYVDFVRKNVDKDMTFTRFLQGTEATLNRKHLAITRLDPADVIEMDVHTVNLEEKSVCMVFMKLNGPSRKELNVALSDQDKVQKLMNYLMPAW